MDKGTGQLAPHWLLLQQSETSLKRNTNVSEPQPETTVMIRVGNMKPFVVIVQL